MANSIRTTSNTQATTLAINQATFAIGDVVLCPSLSNKPFVLTADPYGKRDDLTLEYEDSYFYYDKNGYSIRANQGETDDYQPSLFRNTPANRQAIATLFGRTSSSQTSQCKVIDITDANDKVVVAISSHDLSHIANDICGAANALHDISHLLGLIHYGKIEGEVVKSMTRLSHDATSTWAEILYAQLDIINEPLAMTGYSKLGGRS